MQWWAPGFVCCGSIAASAKPYSQSESALPFNRWRNTSEAPTGWVPAGWRKLLPCWTFQLACFSNLPGLGPPAWIHRFTCSPSRAPGAFSRRMHERPVRGSGLASRSWLKALSIDLPGLRPRLRVSRLSILVSGGSFPREDSLSQEDERRSLAAKQSGSRRQPVARIASRSGGLTPGMNSPIQSRRVASICQDIASAESGAGSGMSLRISLPLSQPQLCE
jgi:hypothetical protein